MSNYLAVATVTAALSQVIRSALTNDVTGAKVTVARPHSSGAGNEAEDPTVNLYLFQVSPNKSLRNNDLPSRSSNGSLRQRSQLALDLNYLITFYGDESELIPQRLLGSVMRTMNSRPILSKDVIKSTIEGDSFTYLKGSDLAEAVESVKFSPIPFSLEELSKLWSVFLQTPYTLSVAFQGTVVLIDGLESPATSLPVRASNIYVNEFRQPVINSVESQTGPGVPIDANSTILVKGEKLRGDTTELKIGQFDVAAAKVTDKLITHDLSTIAATDLRAGVQAIQVVHPLLIGSPAVPHPGVESSASALTIVPIISNVAANDITGSGDAPRAANITVTVNPNIGVGQRFVLMLNERVDNQPQAYTFVAKPLDAASSSITIPVSGVKAATYLVRILVDGASSQLTVDAGTGAFTGPTVVIS